jgi:NADH dehydrogenase FAD-containing subunit
LPLDPRGFVMVDEYLRSPADPAVFAAGDIASMIGASAREGRRLRGAQRAAAGRESAPALAGRPCAAPCRSGRRWR